MNFLCFFFLALFSISGAANADSAPYDVLRYDADLRLNFEDHTVSGAVDIQLKSRVNNLASIELDVDDLSIESVSENQTAQDFQASAGRLIVQFARPAHLDEVRTLSVRYHGKPTRGVRFFPDHVYAFYSTSRWLVCHNEPGDKAAFALKLTLPAGMKMVANGRLIEQKILPGNRVQYAWRQDAPAPTYIYGFAAGKFQEAVKQRNNVQLRFLARENFSKPQLEKIFADTSDMMGFYEQRAGVKYPDLSYTQVLASGRLIGQELSSWTLLPEAYGREVLARPRENNLIAHELAHQWWGNNVTCKGWSDFWLNEAMATFMAAAYQEKQFGRAVYDREIERARQSYARIKAAGQDRPLAYTHPIKESEAGGAIVYDKGAWVIHLLRIELGEKAFWEGVRRYTRKHFGGSVTTRDLQKALEQASGKSLTNFFAQWVYRA